MEEVGSRIGAPTDDLREIGGEACWALSSAKHGNGVEQLRDESNETFWQSDGPQPHLVNIQFQRKVKVSELRLYTSFKVDESYTPSCISVRIGTAHHDLQEVQVVDLKEPDGWITIRLAKPRSDDRPEAHRGSCMARDPECGGAVDFVRTHFVQLAVLSNHQNGRDTHIRRVQVYGPRSAGVSSRARDSMEGCALKLQTPMMLQFTCVR